MMITIILYFHPYKKNDNSCQRYETHCRTIIIIILPHNFVGKFSNLTNEQGAFLYLITLI